MTEVRNRRTTTAFVLLCVAAVAVTTVLLVRADRVEAKIGEGAVAGATLAAGDAPVPEGALVVSTSGRDDAAGTERAPLRTLREAVRRAGDGQAIVLRGGTYRQSAGTVRTRVTIQPYPGERVWFKGSDVVAGWRATGGVWERPGWDPKLCRNCYLPDIIDPAHPLAGQPDMVFADGAPLRQVGSREEVGPGRFFVDTRAKKLVIGNDPGDAVIEATTRTFLAQFDGASAGSVLRGIGVAHYGSNQDYGNRGAMVVANAPGVRLLGNTFAWSASTGALVTKPDAVLRGNSFVHNGLAGLVANEADKIRLVDNEFRANNAERFALGGGSVGAAGAKITHTPDAYVANNRFTDNISNGWWCDLGCTDATVVKNLAANNVGSGLYYEVSSRALIASNVLVGNGRGVKVSSSDGVRLYHNTFAGNPTAIGLYNDPRPVSADPYSEQLGLSWRTEKTELVNNMLTGRTSEGPLLESGDPAGKPVGEFVSRADGNGYVSIGRGPVRPLATWLRDDRVVSLNTLAELRKVSGMEGESLSAVLPSTRFADEKAENYRLAPSAPGVRAGVPLPRDVAEPVGVPATRNPDMGVLTASTG